MDKLKILCIKLLMSLVLHFDQFSSIVKTVQKVTSQVVNTPHASSKLDGDKTFRRFIKHKVTVLENS